jgi:hypothetical protein
LQLKDALFERHSTQHKESLKPVDIDGMNTTKTESSVGLPESYICVILMVLGYPDE